MYSLFELLPSSFGLKGNELCSYFKKLRFLTLRLGERVPT